MHTHARLTGFYLPIFGIVGLFACTQPAIIPESEPISSRESVPDSTIPTRTAEKGASKFWQFSFTSEAQHYNTTATTIIQQSSPASASTDSITTSAQYTLSLTRFANSVTLVGSLNTFSSQAGNRIGTDLTGLSLPASFTGEFLNHELKLDITSNSHPTESSLTCAILARSTLTILRRNIFTIPSMLRTGMTWQDSISTTSCNGLLELNLVILRTYTVVGESTLDGVSVLQIDTKEKTLSNGEGSQDQHRLIVRGDDIGSGRIYLDEITGSLVGLSFENHTTLHIQSSRQEQQFFQSSNEKTTRM